MSRAILFSTAGKLLAILPVGLLLGAFMAGCEEEPTPSLFDPNYVSRPAPVITSVTPPDTFAGIGIVTINGQNFSPVKEENLVYFDATVATVLEASATQLRVRAPNLPRDNIKLRIAVLHADKFSNTVSYRLLEAVSEVKVFDKAEVPWSVTFDAQGNAYVSFVNNNVSSQSGVAKFTPEGTRSSFSPKPTGTPTRYTSLKVGPGGFLYGLTLERRIIQIPAAGGNPTNWVVLPTTTTRLYDMDFDREGNLWLAGNNPEIYRVRQDKNVRSFPFVANVRSVRVFNDHLYLAGNRDGAEKVWRFAIVSADQLGPEEEYFNFSASPFGAAGAGVYAITFAADGDLYIGTDAPEAMVVVHPNRTAEALYPGLLRPKSLSFGWDNGTFLYVIREAVGSSTQALLKVNLVKKSAPYYGRGDN
ncbi:MAG: IPT/TIG domain-containing protein [candidate division KSB1 bacterium]|nr:IPT/TIG domain-containing protein [candidate division KSB1 bacterium]MDZ7272947.1 IPT/TIG domain-containing protein [candidate division KSB1 bacterium]MDZ7285051.1 IPT/TIG domain-containing protein [candidate division KSB1 bacterium]MDZ7298083.1 IPT/TIG domain-containing protein [candidate division KSB1 bacterium]MDZ7309223.1 IPT/TIG domain-containing protein [candidate division KSB1 bacterium]